MTSAAQYAANAPSRSGAERAAAPARRAAGFARPASAHGTPGAILGLQRGAGNNATSALIQRLRLSRAPTAVLQRCGSHPCPASGCHPDAKDVDSEATPKEQGTAALPAPARTAVHGGASGRPLEPGVQAFFQPLFGQDFSGVRVHTDEQAARAADAINASAFTVGNSIWFGRGMYQPGAAPGRRLLAHELAHTIQQRGQPAAQRSLRVGAASDAAEAMADRAADAVLAGEPMPHIGSSGPVIRRAPKVSPGPDDESRRVETDDGSSYLVRRIVGLQQKKVYDPSVRFDRDKENVWLQVDLCSAGGTKRVRAKVGANAPEAARNELQKISQRINDEGQDFAQAISQAEIKPFASVEIANSKQFSGGLSSTINVQPFTGKVTGGSITVEVRPAGWPVKMGGTYQKEQGQPEAVFVNLASSDPGPEQEICQPHIIAVPKISYQCDKIVPEPSEEEKVPVTRTYYRYFEYAKSEFAKSGRTAALDAEGKARIEQALNEDYRIEKILGYASPEGPVTRKKPVSPTGKDFRGNQPLSDERAKAVKDWVDTLHPKLAMRGAPAFATPAIVEGKGELYGKSREGVELKGKELAESSVHSFETVGKESPWRTPDVMEELGKRKTAERQTDTVWPLLRRAKIVMVKDEIQKKTVLDLKIKEKTKPIAKCPDEVISAVSDDFDRQATVKK